MSIKTRLFRHLGLLSFSLLSLLLTPSHLLANTQGTNRQETTLRDYFAELLKKRTTVGGTVLRGDNQGAAEGQINLSAALSLTDELNFKLLPGSKKMNLTWQSKPDQRWHLRVGDAFTLVTGGKTEIDVPATGLLALNTWKLTDVKDASISLTGYWFFLQDLEAVESGALTDMLAAHQSQDLTGSVGYREVCRWMHQEQLLNFNEWCVLR